MNRRLLALATAAALLAGTAPGSAQVASRGTAEAAKSRTAPAPAVHGVEHRLSGSEIRDLAKREVLWCDNYRSDGDDCEAVTLVQLSSDGRLAETTTMLISDGPRLQAFIGEVDDLNGDQVCSKVSAARMPFAFTLEGKSVPQDAAAGLKALLASSLAELDGKTVCQAFYRGEDPTRLREEVTVDGARRKDLETTYFIREARDGFGLRPQVGRDDQKGLKA